MEHSFREMLTIEGAELRQSLLLSVEAPWAELLRRGENVGALSVLEQELERGGGSKSAIRLWWIHTQAESGGVPLSALTSPFEEICSELEEDARPLAAAVGMTLLQKLLARDQLRIAAIVCERCIKLSSDKLSDRVTALLQEILCLTLREELGRAEKRREKSASLESLSAKLRDGEQALKKIRKRLPPNRQVILSGSETPSSEVRAARNGAEVHSSQVVHPPFNERPRQESEGGEEDFGERLQTRSRPKIIEVSFGSASTNKAKEAQINGRGGIAEERDSSSRESVRRPDLEGSGSLVAKSFALLAIFGGVAWYLLQLPGEISPDAMAMNTSSVPQREFEMVLPEMPRVVRPVQKSSSLDEVQRRLENLAKRSRESSERGGDAGEERRGEGNRPLRERPQSGEGDGGSNPSGGESEATESHSSQSKTFEPQYYDPKPRSPKLPELDSEKLAENVLQSLDAVESRLAQEHGAQRELPLSGQALDGSPLKAYQVEQFSEPVIYKTITPTNVLSAPSVLGSAIARLEPDATVQVTSRMGRWLEVRSTGGRRGYIFAQDAVLSEEKRQ